MAIKTKYHFLPYLRKGLNSHIMDIDLLGSPASGDWKPRANVKLTVKLGLEKGTDPIKNESIEKVIELVGPGDVRGISESAIMQTVPSNGDKGYCNDYLAAIEFYEEDLPWRYTPLAANEGRLRPWISLILCKDDEFTEQGSNNGTRMIKLNLNEDNYSLVLHSPSYSHLYAHVQLVNPTNDINAFLENNPDGGISRIFCPRKIEGGPKASEQIHYTAFLIPSFEIGRRRGIGLDIEGVDIQQHAWPADFSDACADDLVFPVYYQWSFASGGDRFADLANKLRPVTAEENAGFTPFITADINDCGLGAYKIDAESEPEKLMDPIGVPVACVKLGFDEADVEKYNSEPHEMRKWMKEKLLDKSPVFDENKLVLKGSEEVVNMNEDPWVVPPIYGAKQALTTELGWDSKNRPKDWVSEQNLTFRHRIAGGLGKKIVQNNQEDFVQRAWLQVEQINALNKIMRERLSAAKLDSSARKLIDTEIEQKKKDNKTSSTTSGFSTDSFTKTIHLSHQPALDAVNVIDEHLELVESYATGNYRNSSAISEEFIETLLKGKDEKDKSQILKNYFAQVVAANPVLMAAVKKYHAYKTASPAAALMDSLFILVYHGLKIDIKNGTFSKRNDKAPFEYLSTSGVINGIYRNNKLDHMTCQMILAWLSGFDNGPGNKDAYDDDCSSLVIRNIIDNYLKYSDIRPENYVNEEMAPNSYGPYANILPFQVLIKGSDEDGFILPDPTYRRFFGTLIDGENNCHGIGVKYNVGTCNDNTPKVLYFFPASSVNRYATGKLASRCSNTFWQNDDGKYSSGNVDVDGDDYLIGELSDCFVEGKVSEDYDFRQNWDGASLGVERGDHCFVLPPKKLGEQYYGRFFSRYGTVCFFIQEIEKFQLKVFESPIVPAFIYTFKNNGAQITISVNRTKANGWIHMTSKHWHTTPDGKSYNTHQVNFSNCLSTGMISFDKKGHWTVNFSVILDEFKAMRKSIENFLEHLYQPDIYEFDPAAVPNLNLYDAWDLIKGDEQIEILTDKREKLWEELISEREFWDTIDKKPAPIIPGGEEGTAGSGDGELIDPSKEALNKLIEILIRYYGSGKHIDIEKLLRSKYPVMAYPEYPDPTYFYLRELSERFILPSAGELPQNSISLFMSNARFEEAFLSGMNTEMGRELLWREYPTDERGSYFRKFWDSEDDPTNDDYWDIKRMDEWRGRLGQNHSADKGSLLIFAIKGELLQCYPQTFLYLTTDPESGYMGKTAIMPAMTSWLTSDTFIAGFRTANLLGNTDEEKINTLKNCGYYLTLQERDTSMHFDYEPGSGNVDSNSSGSAAWASSRLHDPMIWAMPCKYAINI